MNPFDHQWPRLVALARQAPDDRDSAVPAGFATRVTAQAAAMPSPGSWAMLERLALRGVVLASACCAAALAFSYFGATPELADDAEFDQTVSALIDLS